MFVMAWFLYFIGHGLGEKKGYKIGYAQGYSLGNDIGIVQGRKEWFEHTKIASSAHVAFKEHFSALNPGLVEGVHVQHTHIGVDKGNELKFPTIPVDPNTGEGKDD